MKRRTWLLLLPTVAIALAGAACGGDDSGSGTESEPFVDTALPIETGLTPSPAPTPPEPATPTPTPAEPPPATSDTTATDAAPGPVPLRAAPIKQGSGQAAVRSLQEALDYLGYNVGDVDGRFGQQTRRAVREFQNKNGLKATGIANRNTIRAINRQVRESSPEPAAPATPPATTNDASGADTGAEDQTDGGTTIEQEE